MKTKITLIIAKIDKSVEFFLDDYFQIYLGKDKKFPSAYVNKNGVDECINNIFSNYLKIDRKWAKTRISDARTLFDNGVLCTEIVYICYIPSVWDIEKTGTFYTIKELEEADIKIDEFYEKAITRQPRAIY